MSTPVTKVYNFNTPSEYTYDPTKIEVSGGLARLILEDNAGLNFNQPFDNNTGFTYDAAKAEFTGGLVRQKQQTPASATFGANFDASIDGNWGGGSLIGTAFGGAAVASGKLDLTGGTQKYVRYSAIGNAPSAQVGCIRWKWTPNYSGNPVDDQFPFSISDNTDNDYNSLAIFHSSSGQLTVRVCNSTGNFIIASVALGVLNPVAGTEYEFEFDYDLTGGATRIFINGVQFGSTITTTGIRGASINYITLGNLQTVGIRIPNQKINDFELFSTVQHTTNYTPGYTVPDNVYAFTSVALPAMVYSELGDIQAFTGLASTESGNVRQVWNDLYWTGAAWAASDGSWAQSNPLATILANIATFPASDTLSIDVVFNLSNTVQSSISDLTVTFTGQIYPTDNPKITPTTALRTDDLQSISETVTKSGSDDVRYTMSVDGVEKFWNGSAWTNSAGYAQTNTVAEITANAVALISAKADIIPIAYLHSGTGQTTPSILNLAEIGDFAPPEITAPITTPVYGWVYDAKGNPLAGIAITARPTTPAGYNTELDISTKKMETSSAADGYWELFIINTDGMTVGTRYEIQLTGDEYTKTYSVRIPVNANGYNVLDLP